MKRVFLYAHGGSGNHGCEAIVRSTINLLGQEGVTLISSRPEEDTYYGIDKVCNIIKDRSSKLNKKCLAFIKAYLSLKLKGDYIPMDKLWYAESFSNIKKGDIALSIGGDNYCYADVKKYVMLHDMLKDRGAKTVLWGCSVEPDVIANPEIAADLARYDLITARETISYEALKKVNPNTVLVADPAFTMNPEETELPKGFAVGNTVGINLSPMAIERETSKGIAYENYKNLIKHILDNTDMQVALIPHVIWEDGDDRIPLSRLYEEFKETGRVVMVEDHNSCQLKYIISKCRFFVGARTHSTIAAYSNFVPTLVLGYSVKARGIAKDIFGTHENYVVPVQHLKNENDITNAFSYICNNEKQIKDKLMHYTTEWKQKTYNALTDIIK